MKARVKFKKTGSMKFIGHLDIMRFFQKAIRRAEIDVQYSQGYSPHQLISFAAPLGVGLTSEGEYFDIQLGECQSSKDMVDKLNKAMVDGIEVVSFLALVQESKNAMSIVAAADYSVTIKPGYMVCDDFNTKFAAFANHNEILISKKTKKSEKEVDIKSFIYHTAFDRATFDELRRNKDDSTSVDTKRQISMNNSTEVEQASLLSSDSECQVVYMQLATGSVNNLKPELVMEAFSNYIGVEYNKFAYQVHRIEVYADQGDVTNRRLVTLDDLATEIV